MKLTQDEVLELIDSNKILHLKLAIATTEKNELKAKIALLEESNENWIEGVEAKSAIVAKLQEKSQSDFVAEVRCRNGEVFGYIGKKANQERLRLGTKLYLHPAIEQPQLSKSVLKRVVTPIEPLPQNKMESLYFDDCMTVAQLKAYIDNWPETAENGEPCEVWIGDVNGYTNCVKEASPLNFRYSDDKSTCWSDLILFA
jgi:hypothetical protein